jgi:hypothetical protein
LNALTTGLAPEGGQWLLVEAHGDEEGELWLIKTFSFGGFNAPPRCSKKHTGQQASKHETPFNSGDYMIAVQ